jgi:hypothetical protein
MCELLKSDGVDLREPSSDLTIDSDVRVMYFDPFSEPFGQLPKVVLY